jgi:hypothetical protein
MFVKLRLVAVSAVDGGVGLGAMVPEMGNVKVEIRSEVSSRTRMRTSRDARIPLPCVLPAAEHWDEETVVYVFCCVSWIVASVGSGGLVRGVCGVIVEAVSWVVR